MSVILIRLRDGDSSAVVLANHATFDADGALLLWQADELFRRVRPEDVDAIRSYLGSPEWMSARQQEHAHAGTPWSHIDDDRLLELTDQSAPIDQLVAAFGRSPGAIRSRQAKLGLAQTSNGSRELGEMSSAHPRLGQPWTEEEDDELRERVEAGMDLASLCEAHGRNMGGVEARMKRLGLLQD